MRSLLICLSGVFLALLFLFGLNGCGAQEEQTTAARPTIEQQIKGIEANPELPADAKQHAINQLRMQQGGQAKPGQ